MHIVLMLILVILGLALTDKVGLIIGGPICLLGLACLNIGSDKWRNEQESLFWSLGLLCCIVLFITDII